MWWSNANTFHANRPPRRSDLGLGGWIRLRLMRRFAQLGVWSQGTGATDGALK